MHSRNVKCDSVNLLQLQQPIRGEKSEMRLEHVPDELFQESAATNEIATFFSKFPSDESDSSLSPRKSLNTSMVDQFSSELKAALGALLAYLRDFGISHILKVIFRNFWIRSSVSPRSPSPLSLMFTNNTETDSLSFAFGVFTGV